MTNWQWGKYLKQMWQKVSITGNQWKNICNQIFKCVKNKGTVYRIRTTNANKHNRCFAIVIFKVWPKRTGETYSLTGKSRILYILLSYSSFNIVSLFPYILNFILSSFYIVFCYVDAIHVYLLIFLVLRFLSCLQLLKIKKIPRRLIKSLYRVGLSPLIKDFKRKENLQNF